MKNILRQPLPVVAARPHNSHFFQNLCGAFRCSRLCESPCAFPHLAQLVGLRHEADYLIEQSLSAHLAIEHHTGRARTDHRLGISQLVIVGREGKRHQNRRLARRR